jgi:hypothetical protein
MGLETGKNPYGNKAKKKAPKVIIPKNNTAASESTSTDSSAKVQVKHKTNYTQNKEDIDIRDGLKVKHNGRTFATGKTTKPKIDPVDIVGGAPKGAAVAGANIIGRAMVKVGYKAAMIGGKKATKKTIGIDKEQELNNGGKVKKKAPKVKKLENGGSSGEEGTSVKEGGAMGGAALSSLGQVLAPAFDKPTGNVVSSATGAMGTGLAIGASTGTPLGAAIGAGAGLLLGTTTALISNAKEKQAEEKRKERIKEQTNTILRDMKLDSTDVFSTEESIYNNARIKGNSVVGLPGGSQKMFAQGGKVKGPGTSKSDSITANLKAHSVVVPAENEPAAAELRAIFFGNPEKKMKSGGKVPVKLSNGEHVFTPEEKQTIDAGIIASGGNPQAMWDKLIPNPDAGNELKEGTKKLTTADTTGTGSVARDVVMDVVKTAHPGFATQAEEDEAMAEMIKRRRALPKTQQPILLAKGGEVNNLLKELEAVEKRQKELRIRNESRYKNEADLQQNEQKKRIIKYGDGSVDNLSKKYASKVKKAKEFIAKGQTDLAKKLIEEVSELSNTIEAKHNPDNYKYTKNHGAIFSPVLAKKNTPISEKISSTAIPTAIPNPTPSNTTGNPKGMTDAELLKRYPGKTLGEIRAGIAGVGKALPTTTIPATGSGKGSGKGSGSGKSSTATPTQRFDPVELAPQLSTSSTQAVDDAVKGASQLKEVPAAGAATDMENLQPDKFVIDAADILSMGQVLTGIMSANKERPLDKVNPIFASRVAAAIGSAEKAQAEAEYGFSYEQNKAFDSAIENNRRQTMADVVQTTSAAGGTTSALRTISQDKNRAHLDKIMQDQNLKMAKQQMANQTAAQADQMSGALAANTRQIFQDDKDAYWQEAGAAAELMNAGLTNFFNNQQQKKVDKERAKREGNIDKEMGAYLVDKAKRDAEEEAKKSKDKVIK